MAGKEHLPGTSGTIGKISIPSYKRGNQRDYGDLESRPLDYTPTDTQENISLKVMTGRKTSSAGSIPQSSFVKALETGTVPRGR